MTATCFAEMCKGESPIRAIRCGSENWAERTVRMKFALGGLMLFPVYFPARVFTGAPLALPTDPDSRPPGPDYGCSDVRGELINSHPVEHRIPRIRLRRDCIRYSASQYRRFHVTIEGTFDEYFSHFSAERRSKLRRRLKGWARYCGGQTEWREYRRPDEMSEFHRLARQISAMTYQEKLCDAGMPDGEEFVAHLEEMAEEDGVRGYILFDGAKPVAFQYCTIWQNTLAGERQGYDPAYRHHAPGHVLFLLVVRHAFETRRFRYFDLGRGEFDYKETFATGYVRCADIYYFRRTLRNLLLVLGHTTIDLLWGAAARILDTLGLRQGLKRMVRLHYGSHA
jgi:Acetyltransferase (GNAT) domain